MLSAVKPRASRAFSIPEALSAGAAFDEGESEESSCERSRPRVFLVAVLALAPLGLEGALRSSSARRASFSAFLRAASAFLASASSLEWCEMSVLRIKKGERGRTFWHLISGLWPILRLRLLLSSDSRRRLFGQLLLLSGIAVNDLDNVKIVEESKSGPLRCRQPF